MLRTTTLRAGLTLALLALLGVYATLAVAARPSPQVTTLDTSALREAYLRKEVATLRAALVAATGERTPDVQGLLRDLERRDPALYEELLSEDFGVTPETRTQDAGGRG